MPSKLRTGATNSYQKLVCPDLRTYLPTYLSTLTHRYRGNTHIHIHMHTHQRKTPDTLEQLRDVVHRPPPTSALPTRQ